MADYAIKYKISYYRKSGGRTTIDFLKKDYVGLVTNLLASADPLTISKEGDVNNIYKPTVGSGATIRILVTPLSFTDLFTEDPQEYIVKVWDGVTDDDSDASSDGGGKLIWQGFLNANMYRESYSTPLVLKSEVELYCNDGMGLLDNITYDANIAGAMVGDESIASHINALLWAIGIDFTYIYSCHDLSVAISSETNLFLYLKVANENFIDEKGVCMSCRKVLDSLMSGLGLVMYFRGDIVYVVDPINLHNADHSYRYNRFGFDGETAITSLGGYLDISNGDIAWGETGAIRDIVPSVSEFLVKYDPYNFNDYTYDFNDVANWDVEGEFVEQAGMFFLNTTVTFKDWVTTWDNNTIGVSEVFGSDPTFCISFRNTSELATYIVPYANMGADDVSGIKISAEVFAQTKEDSDNIFSAGVSTPIYAYYLQFSVMIGDQYWKDDHWEAGATGNYKQVLAIRQEGVTNAEYGSNPTVSQVADTWTKASKTLPLAGGATPVSGQMVITFYSYWGLATVFPEGVYTALHRMLIKDVQIEVVNMSNGKNVGNEGVESSGRISTNLTGKSTSEINLTNGTGPFGCSRGAFKGTTSGKIIEGLFREGGLFLDTSMLILQSFVSQYKIPRFKINGVLDVKDYLLDVTDKLIQDTNHMPGKAFYIISWEYKDREEIMIVEMVELIGTRVSLGELLSYLEDNTYLTDDTYIYDS